MKYKVGDKVRIKATNEEGEVKFLTSNYYNVEIGIYSAGLMSQTFREGELCDPAPVNVGDVLVDKDVGETRVLDVFENTFIKSIWNDFGAACFTCTFSEIKSNGWKIKPTTDSTDTIEVSGKKYLKKDVEERLKELPETE